jgi:hypothetical protein
MAQAEKAGAKANADATYQQIRQASRNATFSGEYATVNNLVLRRDAGVFTLQSGEVYFLAAANGRTSGAVFVGTGSLELSPPNDFERKSLAYFTESPGLRDTFSQLVIRFSDQTYEEIKGSPNATMSQGGPQVGRAKDAYRDKESQWRKSLRESIWGSNLHGNLDLRVLTDWYGPTRTGFFTAFVSGSRFNKLVFRMDPLGLTDLYPDQVAIDSYGNTDGGTWTAFQLAEEYRNVTTANRDRRLFDITRHTMDVSIKSLTMTVTDRMEYRPLVAGQRVLPFELFRTLRVSDVRDQSGQSLDFVQEDKDDDADFAVILPQAGEVGKTYQLTIEYAGDGALKDSGGGNFFLLPRDTWYPNNGFTAFGDRALFDLTFHFPKGNMLVGVGTLAEPEKTEGEIKTAHWTSGAVELAVAGYNYGKFKKKELVDKDTGYGVEFYANEQVPNELKDFQIYLENLRSQGYMTATTMGSISTTSMGDVALNEAQNSLKLYNLYFGKLPYTRVAMTQQPAGNFGQAWPTLVFMPYIAFMDSTQRTQLLGMTGGVDSFWKYVGPHEVAHQWWGHAVGWKSYRDQWMSEGFAEFSTSLYAQIVRKDLGQFNQMWDDQRNLITQATRLTDGKRPYTVGPISLGYRLNNGKTLNAARALIYPKGAYVLHMIRMMMFDPRNGGDKRFIEMMHEFVAAYYNQDVSTEDFKHVVEKYMTPGMDVSRNKKMDWFFDEWVDGTDIPKYQFDYQLGRTEDGKTTISGRITQSGVAKNFAMSVPVYLDFGSGWVRLGSITLVGNSSFDLPPVALQQAPKKVTLCALNDVLYTSLEVNKR